MLPKATLYVALGAFCGAALRADPVVDRYVEAEMALNGIPGLSLAVVEGGAVTHARAYGVRSIQSREPLRQEVPVELASVSKSFTALAILALERAGRIDRGDAVAGILAEIDGPGWRGVTVHHLLRHRSGLRRRHDFLAPCCDGPGALDPEKAVPYIARADLETPPGESFSYANSNYVLLAAMVQRVLGEPFADAMRERVFLPLGLRRTTVDSGKAREWGSAAAHEWLWGRVRESPSPFLGWPGSSLVKASAIDMGTYIARLLDPAQSPLGAPDSGRSWWEQLGPEYDLGWMIDPDADWLDGEVVLEHTGKIWGGQTAVVLAPRRRAGTAVLINLGTDRALGMARQILLSRLGMGEPKPARMNAWESPDNWAMAFLVSAAGLFAVAGWSGRRFALQIRSGERAWQPGGLGIARAGLLGVLAVALVGTALQWTGPPRAALPSTVRWALPALVGSVTALLSVVASAGLAPRRGISGGAGARPARVRRRAPS